MIRNINKKSLKFIHRYIYYKYMYFHRKRVITDVYTIENFCIYLTVMNVTIGGKSNDVVCITPILSYSEYQMCGKLFDKLSCHSIKPCNTIIIRHTGDIEI